MDSSKNWGELCYLKLVWNPEILFWACLEYTTIHLLTLQSDLINWIVDFFNTSLKNLNFIFSFQSPASSSNSSNGSVNNLAQLMELQKEAQRSQQLLVFKQRQQLQQFQQQQQLSRSQQASEDDDDIVILDGAPQFEVK